MRITARWRTSAWVACAVLGASAPSFAQGLAATVAPPIDGAPSGQEVEVRVELNGATELQQYVIGIEYDPARLEFLSATPLTSSAADGGGFERNTFALDPSDALTSGSSAVAGVLIAHELTPGGDQLERSIAFTDGRTTLPSPDPRSGLFALRFRTRAAVFDPTGILRFGVLDERLHGLTASQRAGLTALTDTLNPQVVAVPEAGAMGGAFAALLSLAAARRLRTR